jgi:hypothetical protein
VGFKFKDVAFQDNQASDDESGDSDNADSDDEGEHKSRKQKHKEKTEKEKHIQQVGVSNERGEGWGGMIAFKLVWCENLQRKNKKN